MTTFAETPRLILRELQASDAEGIFEMDSDPEVHRYLGRQPITAIDQATDAITFVRKQYVDNGIGRWAVIEKATGNFAGWSGLKLITEATNGHIHYYDLGYRLARKYWGKGFATESARAAVDYGFNRLQAPAIYAMADIQNNASRHVLEKSGLRINGIFDLEGDPHHWFELSRHEWEKSQLQPEELDIK